MKKFLESVWGFMLMGAVIGMGAYGIFSVANLPPVKSKVSGYAIVDAMTAVPGMNVYYTIVDHMGSPNLVLNMDATNIVASTADAALADSLKITCSTGQVDSVTIIIIVNGSVQVAESYACNLLTSEIYNA